MATSGSTSFTSTLNEIIKDALIDLNVVGADEDPSAEDYSKAERSLNRLIKNWQAQGYHLWKKKTATIFLQKDQRQYALSSSGDHATLSYVETTLSADEATGQTTLSITSSSGMTAGDFIGIELDDNSLFWSTVSSVPDAISVIINDALTGDASAGAKVYAYTTRLDTPFNVYSAVRESSDRIDLEMIPFSYENYFVFPSKYTSGTPVQYLYDRQLNNSIISVWPIPSNVNFLLKITIASKIEDFISNSNTPDFPQEWHEALVLNLAVKLGPSFGKAGTPSFEELKEQAMESLQEALLFDNEQGSWNFQVDYQGPRYDAGAYWR